jgi:hypothetical protein
MFFPKNMVFFHETNCLGVAQKYWERQIPAFVLRATSAIVSCHPKIHDFFMGDIRGNLLGPGKTHLPSGYVKIAIENDHL